MEDTVYNDCECNEHDAISYVLWLLQSDEGEDRKTQSNTNRNRKRGNDRETDRNKTKKPTNI